MGRPGSVRAQQTRAAAPAVAPVTTPPVVAEAGPGNQAFRITATATTLCAGGSTVLTAVSGSSPVTGPYTWTPTTDMASAGASSKVVVAPLQTTTYTVQGYDINGQPVVASVLVEVQTNCCQQNMPGPAIVELQNVYGGVGNPAEPFVGAAPGTRYHVSGDLTLHNDDYTLPVGGVLLMDAGARIILDDAILILDGSTITAACDEMWGGVVIPQHNHGFFSRAKGTLRSRLMHSFEGVSFEEGIGTSVPPFGIEDTDFLHNRQSVSLARDVSPAQSSDYLRNCLFDSDPQQFKAPWRYQSSQNYYLSYRHVVLGGDVRQATLRGNTFRNALYGVFLAEQVQPNALLHGNHFANCYLAGVYGNDKNFFGSSSRTLTMVDNDVDFPVAAQVPATPQVQTEMINFVPQQPLTFGVYVRTAAVTLLNNRFTQRDSSSYDTYNFAGARTPQIGIEARLIRQVEDNRFYLLHTGLVQRFDLSAGASLTNAVKGNAFVSCATGISLRGTNANGPQPTFVTCNTFNRGRQRPGTAYGIFFENGTNGVLADPALGPLGPQAILKNLFLGETSNNQFFHLSKTSAGVVQYHTFDEYVNVLVLEGNINPRANGSIRNSLNCQGDGYEAGIQQLRFAHSSQMNSQPNLIIVEQNVPNPTAGRTSVVYELPNAVKSATLLITSVATGRLVHTQALSLQAVQVELNLTALPAGVYSYRIVTDGTGTNSRQLVVVK